MADLDFTTDCTNGGGFDGGYITFNSDSLITTEGKEMTRKRYMEILKIADELCNWMKKKGIKQEEGCSLRKLTEELWRMEK